MNIHTDVYDKRNEREVQQFIDTCSDEAYLQHVLASPKLTCAYIAKIENKMVGAMIAWKNDFHPNCTYFRILIDSSDDQKIIAKKLLLQLENDSMISKPLQTSIWDTDEHLKGFFEMNDFIKIRKTYMPTLNTSKKIPINRNNNHVYTLMTMADISTNEDLLYKMTRLVKDVYEQTHLDNPVAELSLVDWQKLMLADDLIMDRSFVYFDTNKRDIVAYSFLHASESKDTIELGWCDSKDKRHIKYIPQLVEQQIKYAYKNGFRYMVGEFDTTSGYAMKVYEDTPFPRCISWLTYQLS